MVSFLDISEPDNANPWIWFDGRAGAKWPCRFSVGAPWNCTWIFQMRFDLIVNSYFCEFVDSVYKWEREFKWVLSGTPLCWGCKGIASVEQALLPPMTLLCSCQLHQLSTESMPLSGQGNKWVENLKLSECKHLSPYCQWAGFFPLCWWALVVSSLPLVSHNLPHCYFTKYASKKF